MVLKPAGILMPEVMTISYQAFKSLIQGFQ